jgi:hypothetical protein
MMLANTIVSHYLKIRASTPVLPSKPLPSRFTNDTFSKTDNVLIPDALEFEVINVPLFS